MGLNKGKNRKLNMEFVWIICIPIDTIDNTFGYTLAITIMFSIRI